MNPHAKKLSADQVRIIRENREGMTDSARARMMGVHANTVMRVRHFMTWSSVK